MSFNANDLMNSVQQEANATKLEVCPEGEFRSMIQSVDIREFKYKNGERAGQTGYSLDVNHLILDPSVEASLGRQPSVRQSLMLDLTPAGGLDFGKGKNVGLGRLREAVGQNQPGKPWSMKMLEGQQLIVAVSHRMDGDNLYSDIKKVRAAE